LIELRFYVALDTKQVISETFPKPISWFGMEKTKQNTTSGVEMERTYSGFGAS